MMKASANSPKKKSVVCLMGVGQQDSLLLEEILTYLAPIMLP